MLEAKNVPSVFLQKKTFRKKINRTPMRYIPNPQIHGQYGMFLWNDGIRGWTRHICTLSGFIEAHFINQIEVCLVYFALA